MRTFSRLQSNEEKVHLCKGIYRQKNNNMPKYMQDTGWLTWTNNR